jgi:hypothetical protein
MLAPGMLREETQYFLMKPAGLLDVRDVPGVGYDDERAVRYLMDNFPGKISHMPQRPP